MDHPSPLNVLHPKKSALTSLRLKRWAMPVHRRGWAVVSVVLQSVNQATGYRLSGAPSHRSWERAIKA